MRKQKPGITWSKIVLTLVGLALLAALVYQIPPVKERLYWRVELAVAYLRGVIYPARAVPTPGPSASNPAGQSPTPATPLASPTTTSTPLPLSSPTPGATATPPPSPTPLPGVVSLAGPLYERQDWNNCGPATLAMHLRYYGWEGDQFDISTRIKPDRGDRNVNVEELVYYVRNHAGWLNIEFRVGGDIETIKKFLAAGIPVMIEEGTLLDEGFWPNDDLWAGHYLLITGYNDEAGFFNVLDSYRPNVTTVSYADTLHNWQAFNYVYILIYLPSQADTVKSLLGEDWDVNINRQHALELAQAEIDADPNDAFAWFNRGSNLVYFERYAEATTAYDNARNLGLPQRMLRYQFGPFFAYFHAGFTDELLALTEYALQRTDKSEEAHLWHGWGLYRKNDTQGAIADWRRALEVNPNYQDARYALDFVGASP